MRIQQLQASSPQYKINIETWYMYTLLWYIDTLSQTHKYEGGCQCIKTGCTFITTPFN